MILLLGGVNSSSAQNTQEQDGTESSPDIQCSNALAGYDPARFSSGTDPGSGPADRHLARENGTCQATSPMLASHCERPLIHAGTSDHHPLPKTSSQLPQLQWTQGMSNTTKGARQTLPKTSPDSGIPVNSSR